MPISVNRNKTTAVTVNGIPIPNEHITWYATKQNGKVIGAKAYIDEKGLEYLAGRMGLYIDPRSTDPNFPIEKINPAIQVVPVKMPGQENDWGGKNVCIFKAFVRMKDGQVFEEYGTATPENLNTMQKKYPIEMAITRAKARALRSATACNICSMEEASLEVSGDKVLIKGLPGENGQIIDAEWFPIVTSGGGQ